MLSSASPARRRALVAGLGLTVVAGLAPSAAEARIEPTPPAAAVAGSPSAPMATAGAATPGADGIGDRYWPLDGNGGIDVLHYDIDDTYDFETARLSGTTSLSIRATQDLSRFNLDFLLPVTSVTVDGAPASVSRPQRHELEITPAVPLADGARFTVEVAYAGAPTKIAYAGERNWAASDDEVVTMNEPHMAPWWFPANDHPTDKATFDITVTGPATHQAVANGLLVDRSVDGDLATTHWRSTDPMAPYLAFFALGRYDVSESTRAGLPSYVAVSQQLPSSLRRSSTRALKQTPAITAWLDERLGAYPFESTGGLATTLDVGFALENQTRPTYSFYSLYSADRLSTVVHELAHQWFGDSVSVRRWSDIWLNEGFASFMEQAYAEKHGGVPAQRWLRSAYDARRLDRDFWALDLADPGRNRIFATPVYERGAMALQALRHRIGDRDFWATLRTWVRSRRHGNGSVAQFERLAEQTSDQQLDRFFRVWLRAPRPPAPTRANGLR